MKTVIFVCSGNTCRSPMAEVLFKKMLENNGRDDVEVISRGISVYEGDTAADEAVTAVKEYGCDLSRHKATALSMGEAVRAFLLVAMTEGHKRLLKSYGIPEEKIKVLGVSDPFGGDISVYRDTAKEIYEKLGEIYGLV